MERTKLLRTGGKVLRALLASLILLIGLLCFLLAEPLYGLAFLLLGLSVFPFFWRLLGMVGSFKPSRPLRMGISLGIAALIFTGLSLQGRATYDRTENITASALDSLSIHPVKRTEVNGLDYYYIEAGVGDPVVLLHGFPDMANTWDETITELSKNHRVIAPFLRGYYPTGIPADGDYAVKTIAGDIVQLTEKLQLGPFDVVGQDWGASISYSVANLAPAKVKRVVAIAIAHPTCFELSPKMLWFGRHFLMFNTGSFGVRYARKNDFAYIDRLYERWSPDYENYHESSDAIKETFKYPGRLEAAIGYYRSFRAEQGNEERAAFYQQKPQVPVLYLGGENDGGVKEEFMTCHRETMAPGSKAVMFKDAGHFLHHEVAEAFYSELKDFLKPAP